MNSKWMIELWRAGGLLLTALILGWFFDRPFLFLLLGAIAYLAWHVFNLVRLERWLKYGEKSDPPASSGVWADVFNEIYRLEMRSRKQQRKLARTLNRFEEAAAALPDGIVVLSTNGVIEWFNTAARDTLGLRSPQDIGQRIANLLRHPDFIEMLGASGPSRTIELISPINSEIMLTAQIVPYGREQHLLVTRDITRMRHLEQVRRDFVANVSHELRTPLTAIRGYVEALMDGPASPEDTQRFLEIIARHSARMERLVKDLLRLARLDAGQEALEVAATSVEGLFAGVVSDLQPAIDQRRQTVDITVDPDLSTVRVDPAKMHDVLRNLVENASAYAPEGSRIMLAGEATASQVRLIVADTGHGIPETELSRIFERFYRVDKARSRESGGTGLGLSIVRHLVELHGGHVSVANRPEGGAQFTITLPKA